MTQPLFLTKAEFFKTLGNPTRIRVLELLAEREHAVSDLLHKVDVRATRLSRQLAVLRRAGLVASRKEGPTRYYSLTSPRIAELLVVARRILTEVLSRQVEPLEDLRASPPAGRSRRRTR